MKHLREIMEEIEEIELENGDELLTEVAARRKYVVRKGKKVLKYMCPRGYIKSGKRSCKKSTGAAKMRRSRAARKAARKRKGQRAAINRKRRRSNKRRKSMGLNRR